ncbi:MAG: beta-galactosidase [Clostridia bacterium]|nr:beta-galactosidase [Clostridia bacterium]
MYRIKRGRLFSDGKAVFALGQSYYPSFHTAKYPVAPEGDRIGEMKKDLRGMRDMGFNHVRFAALGEVTLGDDGKVKVSTPFIDEMIKEADALGLSVSVRLEGYSVNLRGFKDTEPVNWNGEVMDDSRTKWYDFVRTTTCHDGLLEDDRTYATALAEHYKSFKNVVGFQIYNEPHMPGVDVCDYHPLAIEKYRAWLTERGVLTEEEAKDYEPPRSREEGSPRMWALWRLFSRDMMTAFLKNPSDAARAVAPELATYTCYTSNMISPKNTANGTDPFKGAVDMEILGFTTYVRSVGSHYPALRLQLDLVTSAAKLAGGESWCIEMDSRTYIPPFLFNRNTYLATGSGLKGLLYYQWRGDYPAVGVPFPNSCGLLNYDGTKTANFDNAARAVKTVNEMSDLLMGAERAHEGVGILHSDYAVFYRDALENRGKTPIDDSTPNAYLFEYVATYREITEANYTVDIVNAEALKENAFGIKVLFVPRPEYLSPEEAEAVEDFRRRGGHVIRQVATYYPTTLISFIEVDDVQRTYMENVYNLTLTARDAIERCEIYPIITSDEPTVAHQLLEGEGYKIITLTNTSAVRMKNSASLTVRFPFSEVSFKSFDGEGKLNVRDNKITVEDMTDGGYIIIKD